MIGNLLAIHCRQFNRPLSVTEDFEDHSERSTSVPSAHGGEQCVMAETERFTMRITRSSSPASRPPPTPPHPPYFEDRI